MLGRNTSNTQTKIKWNIINKFSVYRPCNSYCELCLSEKICKQAQLRAEADRLGCFK